MGRLTSITTFWSGLAGPSRRLIIGAAVALTVGLLLLMRISGSASYATVATTENPRDAAAVTKELDSQGIAYRLRDGGTTVQVQSSMLDKARLGLASSNVGVTGSGGTGWEIFDKSNFGATDFTQRINLVRAMEGELSRMLSQLDQVNSATVRIAMPQERLFTDDALPTTAAVVLNLAPGAELDPSQVKGVTNLVANNVPGLTAKSITITDTKGNTLEGGTGDATGAGGANARMAIETAYEKSTQTKLDAMLAATLGPGKAVTQVDATLDLDKVSQQTETFGGKVVPLTVDKAKEKLRSKGGSGSGGVVGTSPNTPGNTFPATTTGAGGSTSAYDKSTNRSTNGTDRTLSQIEKTPGALTRQSVSVQISDDVATADLTKLQSAVEAAVGYDQVRGDVVTVQSTTFSDEAKKLATNANATAAPGAGPPMDYIGMARTGAIGLGVLAILLAARRSLRRRQSALERALPELLARGPVPVAQLTGPGMNRLEGQTKSPIERQVEELAMRKPDDMARLLRGWLIEGNKR
jgi:flagellar M-ring protein FliF